MAINSIYNRPTRMVGIASGMDTQSMVESALKLEQMKVDKTYKNKTKLEWKREAYTSVSDAVKQFQQKFMSATSKDNLWTMNAFRSYATNLDKNDFIDVTSTGGASVGSHKITKVQLARSARLEGANFDAKVSAAKVIDGVKFVQHARGDKVQVNELDKDGNKVMIDKLDSAGKPVLGSDGKPVKVEKMIDVTATTKLSQLAATGATSVTFNVNGKDVKLPLAPKEGETPKDFKDLTVNDMMDAVNNDKAIGAHMSLSGGRFRLANSKDGAVGAKDVPTFSASGDFLSNIGFKVDPATKDVQGAKGKLTDMTFQEYADYTGQSFTAKYTNSKGAEVTGFAFELSDGKNTTSVEVNSETGEAIVTTVENGKTKVETKSANEVQNLGSVISLINNASAGAKVKMDYDAVTNTFVIKSDSPPQSIQVKNAYGAFFSAKGPIRMEPGEIKAEVQKSDSIATLLAKQAPVGQATAPSVGDEFGFTINGQSFTFDAGSTSISSMMSEVNSNTSAGVKMTFSEISNSFQITSNSMGEDAKVEFSNNTYKTNEKGEKVVDKTYPGASKMFGLGEGDAAGNIAAQKGSDALVTIDGREIKRASNTFTIDGMTFNLKAAMDATVGGTDKALNYDVTAKAGDVVEKVKTFVTEYNALVKTLNDKISEKVSYAYSPLTEEEESSLSEKNIADLEAKAKEGLLRNDTEVSTLLSNMRAKLFQEIGNTGLSANDIGLSTGAWYDKGQIRLDENKLKEALEKNPDAVATVFLGMPKTGADGAVAKKDSGLLTGFYDMMTSFNKKVSREILVDNKKKIEDATELIAQQREKMYQKEDTLWKQFSQMEKLMAQYQSQSNFFSQLAG